MPPRDASRLDPTRPSPAAAQLAEQFALGRRQPPRAGLTGAQLGRGAGASIEFHDRRPYHPGDDVRRMDWRAYARTDRPYVQLYREEVDPRIELLVDVSRSMAVDPAKAQLATDLAALVAAGARADGVPLAVWTIGDACRSLPSEALFARGLEFDGTRPLGDAMPDLRPFLRAGATRLLVSDFLSPFDAEDLVRGLSSATGSLALVQVLAAEDLDPPPGRALRLTDSETGEWIELVLDEALISGYRARLERLRDGLSEACRGAGARIASVSAAHPLEDLCREALARAEILAVR